MKYAVCGTRKGNIYKGKLDFVIFLKYKIKYKGYSIKKKPKQHQLNTKNTVSFQTVNIRIK